MASTDRSRAEQAGDGRGLGTSSADSGRNRTGNNKTNSDNKHNKWPRLLTTLYRVAARMLGVTVPPATARSRVRVLPRRRGTPRTGRRGGGVLAEEAGVQD
jgi:hypothetical protein